MESGFFLDFVFTVSLTVIVCFILSKLQSYFAEDVSNATCNSSSDGFVDKAGVVEQVREKFPRLIALGEESDVRSSGLQVVLSEVDDHGGKELRQEKVGEENINKNEGFGGIVEEVFLEDLEGEKESVGGDIKEKVVEECSELWPIFREIHEELQERRVAEISENFELGEELEASKETERDESRNREGNNHEGEEEGIFDDWEGVERTELERRFDAAVAFVASKSNADSIDSNLRMQFYGLHRVAMEGPCHGPQPMALKFSARAKWNAWQKQGDISGDMAMEHYIALLSKSIPGWKDEQ